MEVQEEKYLFNNKIYNITKSEKLYEYIEKKDTGMKLFGNYNLLRDVVVSVYKSKNDNLFVTEASIGRISCKDVSKKDFLSTLLTRGEIDLIKKIYPSEYIKLKEV
ncbi:MAG TPA: hypothetical protein GX707_16620 [Epulopiscium sp.]|nr:hypothetical protein [Candidatus Epulonipiscium sp.]